MNKYSFLILTVIILLGTGCLQSNNNPQSHYNIFTTDEWSAFYYPNADLINESNWIIQHKLISYEDCLDWVDATNMNRNGEVYDYECGLNCRYDLDWEMYRCEETF